MKGKTMSDAKVLLRRYKDDLNVAGFGVVILTVWNVLKGILLLIIGTKSENKTDVNPDVNSDVDLNAELNSILDSLPAEERELAIAVSVVGVLLIVAVIVLCAFLIFKLHLYIGLNASKAAKGQPYKKGYYTAAIILLTFSVLSIIGDSLLLTSPKEVEDYYQAIASFIVELTTTYILWVVVSSTRKIRKLESSLTQE